MSFTEPVVQASKSIKDAKLFQEDSELSEKQKLRRAMKENKDSIKDTLKIMSPSEIFALFDEDDSGVISFEEFRKMLPYLDIYISDAKAFRYFRICDTDGSGEIDIDEFQVALFACDPTSGNPVGFVPSKNLTPLDAFEMFDEDRNGFMDEDEFAYAVEYLGINLTDAKKEEIFFQFDYDRTGTIDYEEFREIFILTCDLRRELEDRGVDVPAFGNKKKLQSILRSLLVEEERKERRALAEAKRHKQWIFSIKDKRRIARQAEFRAYYELRAALDMAGHVYVFGEGTNKQFSQSNIEKISTENFSFEHFERVLELWRDRTKPQQIVDRLRQQRRAEEQDDKRDADRNHGGGFNSMGALGSVYEKKKLVIDPFKEALESTFHDITASVNTAALWGRRIHHVAASESVIFALADTGEVFTWGGKSFWWHEIQPDAEAQTKWRGDTTPRSQLLMGTVGKPLPMDVSLDVNIEELSPDDQKTEMIKVVCKYYNVWEPPPNPATRMLFLEKELLPRLVYDDIKFSLKCRGKIIDEATKLDLIKVLHEDIMLEKKLLGERAHKAIRELETQVLELLKRKKEKLAMKIMNRIESMWKPLVEVQVEQKAIASSKVLAEKHNKQMTIENSYIDWRNRIADKRDDLLPEYTPRGNSLQLNLHGITPRGPRILTPRGFQTAVSIAAGNSHACLVHKSGQLYSWGVGASGRLGLDLTEQGNPQKDTSRPRLVQSLSGRPVIRVSCGFSHSAAIVAGGDVYVWGSATQGKLGLGDIVTTEECYCSIPTRVLIGPEDRKVRKISCGSAHTGVITDHGQLYLFGCGDGGRLGMGVGVYVTVYQPMLVKSLSHLRLANISCGNTTTVVSTEVSYENIGEEGAKYRGLVGGHVYVCGSRNVLGVQCDVMTLVKDIEDIPMKQVSAGYNHTVLVSAEGELYCWGQNHGKCCGTNNSRFIPKPTPVPCMYTKPSNLALLGRARQSSTYHGREAHFAINGEKEGVGVKKCSCTQQDPQSWWEVDLGRMCVIDEVHVWNRTDSPRDAAQPRDLYTAKLFPCWVMIGREAFATELNTMGLKNNLRDAVAKIKFTENSRCSRWKCPGNTQGRFVRVQLEGFNPLALAEVEIFGHYGLTRGVGRVSYAIAGRDVTIAVVRPITDPKDVENAYCRAAYADPLNADILRQLETFALCYDMYGRGDSIANECRICKGDVKCESCLLYQTYADEIDQMPPEIGGRRPHLKSVTDFLLNSCKPPLIIDEVPKKNRPTKWELKKDRWNPLNWFTKKQKDVTREDALEANPEEIFEKLQFEEAANMENAEKERLEDEKAVMEIATLVAGNHSAQLNVAHGKTSEQQDTEDQGDDDNQGSDKKKKKKNKKHRKRKDLLTNPDDDVSLGAASSIGASVVSNSRSNAVFLPRIPVINAHEVQSFESANSALTNANPNPVQGSLKAGDILESGHRIRSAIPKSLSSKASQMNEINEMDKRRTLNNLQKDRNMKEKELVFQL